MLAWVWAVRLPFMAFAYGAAAATSDYSLFWWLAFSPVFFAFVELTSLFLFPVGLIVYFVGGNPWLALILTASLLIVVVDSSAGFTCTKHQVELLQADLLSGASRFRLEELDVDEELLKGFPTYSTKKKGWELSRRLITFNREFVSFLTKPLRVFQFEPLGRVSVTGAAVAFSFDRYPSLIFVRNRIEALSDAQMFQLFHELAHGTPEGRSPRERAVRWDICTHIYGPIACLVLIPSCIATVVAAPWHVDGWMACGALLVANALRNRTRSLVADLTDGASEALADAVALAHPRYSLDDKWIERAQRLSLRLSDELSTLKPIDERYFPTLLRRASLQRWLTRGEVLPYYGYDVHWPYLLPAVALFAMSGYFAIYVHALPAPIFWGTGFLTVLATSVLARNGLMSHQLLLKVDSALTERLKNATTG